jgi:dienelactone hydrolase
MARLIPPATLMILLATLTFQPAAAQDAKNELASQLRKLDLTVLATDKDKAKQLSQMLAEDVRSRLRAANERSTKDWQAIKTKAEWESFREERLKALRDSLGHFPPPPKDLKVQITRTLKGEGYRIENLVFESRPGLIITANLYLPAEPPKSMPGILICHSHHNPKTQGELQDMGMTWARLGCMVLVMDQLGHGERRQHPFRTSKDYPDKFQPGRQDYYFRYNTGLQLHLVGDSLIGWMTGDLMRGVDLLLARPGIDKERIILLGAVAGGGDPVAVTAALDRRIKAVVPFNFGGPQPETTYPLPAEAEKRFNYAGSGSWESTRNLRHSARDGFLPWVIVGSAAPRPLIYAHEFSWDKEHDPVWQRLQKIYEFYKVPDRLAATSGRGKVTGKPPESTHCNNIGPEHRKSIYPALKRWFNIPSPEKEYQKRHSAEELLCVTSESGIKPRPLFKLAGELGALRMEKARAGLTKLTPEQKRATLRQDWERLLGPIRAKETPKVVGKKVEEDKNRVMERVDLKVERDIHVPLVLLLPPSAGHKPGQRLPVVVGLAQEGKQRFLKKYPGIIAGLLNEGVAVCLPDVRGTGETSPGGSRERRSPATSLSASELMLGQTMLGARLRDLHAVLTFLDKHKAVDGKRIALWGESFAPVNGPKDNLAVPLDADKLPHQAEPLGGLLALFGALFNDNVTVVYIHGGLSGYQSILQSPFCDVPHDIVVPGALTSGDLCDVAATLAPRPLRLEGLVDGLNRRVTGGVLVKTYAPTQEAYAAAAIKDRFQVAEGDAGSAGKFVPWLVQQLKAK